MCANQQASHLGLEIFPSKINIHAGASSCLDGITEVLNAKSTIGPKK